MSELHFRVALAGLYAAFHLIRLSYALKVARSGGKVYSRKDDDRNEGLIQSRLGLLAEVLMPVSVVLYAVYPQWVARLSLPFPDALRVSGGVASLVALAHLVRVHRALGRFWSASLRTRDDHALVTSGPYARVRHPMYTALISNMLCLSVLSANLVVILPRALQISLILLRLGREESMMLARFGEEYRAYMSRTGRLLPRRAR
jgi:protein-S-isoprenylcysteine O-methyltransferase Ste14